MLVQRVDMQRKRDPQQNLRGTVFKWLFLSSRKFLTGNVRVRFSPRLASAGYPPHPEPTSVYCPSGMNTGSPVPIRVSEGYYTVGGEHLTNKTRFAQRICPVGHYCEDGRKIRCPAGRYGGKEGLAHINCSGTCNPGYFCPPGSWEIDQVRCGNGTRSPCYTHPRGTVASYRPSGERRCEFHSHRNIIDGHC